MIADCVYLNIALSIPLVVPRDFVVGKRVLDKFVSHLVVCATEALRVAIDDNFFIFWVAIDSAASWARRRVVGIEVLVFTQFFILKFLEYIRVKRAVSPASHNQVRFAPCICIAFVLRLYEDLDVFERAFCVKQHWLDRRL